MAALKSADMVGTGLDEPGIQAWLSLKKGKECLVAGVKGVPTHFTVIQDGNCPAQLSSSELVTVTAVREGEKVTFMGQSVVAPLEVEHVAGCLADLEARHRWSLYNEFYYLEQCGAI
ncbi:unnamed protein product [Effrenium voratum]|nr:unnamed protein product [Effrenium voratum]